MTLLIETQMDINAADQIPEDIVFIGSEDSGHSCTWDEFKSLADFNYDSGYGSQKIAEDLIIIFKDGGRLYRTEYDGAEDWEYIKPFKIPKVSKVIKSLGGNGVMWKTLKEVDELEE